MGAGETKENAKSLSNYSFLKRESHAYYGEISLMKEKENGNLVAIKEQVYQHNRDFQIELRNLTQQTKRIHQNILQLFKVASMSENHLCSTVYKLAWTLEFLEKDLNSEIIHRRKTSHPFTERELWSLLFQVASGMAFLQSNNISHGDLRSEKIFISQDGVFKIVDPSTIKSLPAYAMLLTGSGSPGIYLSPQLMEAFRAQNWTPAHDSYKSDVFTLGVIMLEAAFLCKQDDIFEYNDCLIREDLLVERLGQLKELFGEPLGELVEEMVTFEDYDRCDFIELTQRIRKVNSRFMTGTIEAPPEERVLRALNDHGNVVRDKPEHGKKAGNNVQFTLGECEDKENNGVEPQFLNNLGLNIQKEQSRILATGTAPLVKSEYRHSFNPQSLQVLNIPRGRPGGDDEVPLEASKGRQEEEDEESGFRGINSNRSFEEQYEYAESKDLNSGQNFDDNSKFFVAPSERRVQVQPLAVCSRHIPADQDASLIFYNGRREYEDVEKIVIDCDESRNLSYIQQPNESSGVKFDESLWRENKSSFKKRPPQQPEIPLQMSGSVDRLDHYSMECTPEQILVKTQAKPRPVSEFVQDDASDFPRGADSKPINIQDESVDYEYCFSNKKPQQPYPQVLETQAVKPTPFSYPSFQHANALNAQPEQSQRQAGASSQPQHVQQNFAQTQPESLAQPQPQGLPKPQGLPQTLPQGLPQTLPQVLPQQASSQAQFPQDLHKLEPGSQQTKPGDIQIAETFIPQNDQQDWISFDKTQKVMGRYGGTEAKATQAETSMNKSLNFIAPEVQAILNEYKMKARELTQIPVTTSAVYDPTESEMRASSASLSQSPTHNKPSELGLGSLSKMVPLVESGSSSQEIEEGGKKLEEPKKEADPAQEYYEDGSIYQGEKLHGLRHGKGKFYYGGGGTYEGEWKFGRIEGFGTLLYPNGSIAYQGQWEEDKFNGRGVVYNEVPHVIGVFDYSNFDKLGDAWIKFEGDFKDDRKEGFGTLFISNGDKFSGKFVNDFVNGKGTYYRNGCSPVEGEWSYNRLLREF